MIKKYPLLFASLINIVIYITIILIPKEELTYKIFYLIFLVCIILSPLVLMVLSYFAYHKGKDPLKLNIMSQVLSLAFLTLITTQIFFIKSIVEDKRLTLGLTSIGISLVLFGLAFIIKYLKLSKRKTVILLALSLIIYFAYLSYCVDLSYKYSISW